MRCAFHGWLFDVAGQCLETPAEPEGSRLCANIRQTAYPVVEKSGILFAYLGPGEPPAFPHFDCFVAPATHTFAFKGMIDCNWLQSLEVGIDPAHTSFLHRFFHDEDPRAPATASCSATSRSIPTADDAHHARAYAPADRGGADRLWHADRDAAPHRRRQDPCAGHQSRIPARLRHSDVERDDDHAMARADRRHAPLLVRDLYELRRAGGQGRDAAQRLERYELPTTSRARTAATTTASTRTSSSTRPSPAWAPTSTCTTSGPASRWGRSRTAPRSISASPTRRSAPIGASCDARSRRRQTAASRRWCWTRHRADAHRARGDRRHCPDRRLAGLLAEDRRGAAQGVELGEPTLNHAHR